VGYEKNMEISGKPTIHPFLFITGKASGYITWLILVLALLRVGSFHQSSDKLYDYIAFICMFAGALIVFLSSFKLGNSLRIGLPTEQTTLKTEGIYHLSRNPMYVGLHLITLASIVYTSRWWVALLGFYSYYMYHLIISGEEHFLESRFGSEYLDYKHKVRRYL
jgi:protein-S-isoprenylcysteine O-methyltransferase Ste14